MSGGSMEYVYTRIREAAEHAWEAAKEAREHWQKGDLDWFNFNKEFAVSEYGDKYEFRNRQTLARAVVRRLYHAVEVMREASVYAQRVEWLTSGDDGYESFVGRLDEELKELDDDSSSDAWGGAATGKKEGKKGEERER